MNHGDELKHSAIVAFAAVTVSCAALLSGCASTGDKAEVAAESSATPAADGLILGNGGKYMSPFTEDGVTAAWVDKALNAKLGAALGQTAGTYAGQKALEQVPYIGGWLGGMAGKTGGRAVAIQAVGGWSYIKSTSDLSFNSLAEMAAYMQAHNSMHPQYAEIIKATSEIYPDFAGYTAAAMR